MGGFASARRYDCRTGRQLTGRTIYGIAAYPGLAPAYARCWGEALTEPRLAIEWRTNFPPPEAVPVGGQ
jgi:hypothetical protein